MGIILDFFKSIKDMKKLSKLQETLEAEMNKLDAEGKLPQELKTAIKELEKPASSEDNKSVQSSVDKLEAFTALLEKHEDIFPESCKKIISEYEDVTKDMEGIAKEMDHLNS